VSAAYAANNIEAKVYYKNLLGSDEYGVGASYDMNNGLVLSAGYIGGDSLSDDDFATYVTAEYDLGGGASLFASYADQENTTTDDIDTVVGGYELKDGATVALSFKF
jgi:predicted porin